jgi:hypothetical protein
MISEPVVRSTLTMHLSCVKICTISKQTVLSLEPRHLVVPSGASKSIFELVVHLAQTVNLSCTNTNCLQRERSEIPHDPCHLGVPSGASQMIYVPMVRLTQTIHLSCVKISTMFERNEMSFHLSLVTLWYHQVRPKWFSEPMLCLAQTTHLPCTDTNTVSIRKEARFHMTHHLGVPSSESKMIFEPMVRSTQTVHLSCIKITTISKWTKLALPKQFLSQWYV